MMNYTVLLVLIACTALNSAQSAIVIIILFQGNNKQPMSPLIYGACCGSPAGQWSLGWGRSGSASRCLLLTQPRRFGPGSLLPVGTLQGLVRTSKAVAAPVVVLAGVGRTVPFVEPATWFLGATTGRPLVWSNLLPMVATRGLPLGRPRGRGKTWWVLGRRLQ